MPLAKPIGIVSDSDRERFAVRVGEPDNNGCRVWLGHKSRVGYGQFWVNNRNVSAHRFAWVVVHGEQPRGLQIDHLCRNKLCVEIKHMELTEPRVNTLRAVAVNYWTRTACKNGHDYETAGYYFSGKGTKTCRECKRIVARKCWAKARDARSLTLGGES